MSICLTVSVLEVDQQLSLQRMTLQENISTSVAKPSVAKTPYQGCKMSASPVVQMSPSDQKQKKKRMNAFQSTSYKLFK